MICMAEFTDKSNKYRHIRKQHQVRVKKQQCLICNKLFYSIDSHKRHSVRHHNGVIKRQQVFVWQQKEEPKVIVCDANSQDSIDDLWFNQIIETVADDDAEQ